MAALYKAQGRYSEAALLYKRALEIREKAFGPDHPQVASSLNKLAEVSRVQGEYAEAESLYKRAGVILEKAFGQHHPRVAAVLKNMAECRKSLAKKDEAGKFEARAKSSGLIVKTSYR